MDLAVECSGINTGVGDLCHAHAPARHRIVQTGLHTKPATLDAMALSEKDLSLYGSWCYRLTDWPRIIRLVASGRYPVAKAVTTRIALPDVVEKGFDVLVDPRATSSRSSSTQVPRHRRSRHGRESETCTTSASRCATWSRRCSGTSGSSA